jgi:hypothetical protein
MNHYEVLNINRNASINEIIQAFKYLAKKYHHDINNEEGAEEKFILIYEAYNILKNHEKRKTYDEILNKNHSSEIIIKYEKSYNKWKTKSDQEAKYYAQKNYDLFVKNVINKIFDIGIKTIKITFKSIIVISISIMISLILSIFVFLLASLILGFDILGQYFLLILMVIFILNSALIIFIYRKIQGKK